MLRPLLGSFAALAAVVLAPSAPSALQDPQRPHAASSAAAPHETVRVHGFEVRLANGFREHALHDEVMALLADHLFRIARVVADPALGKLRAIPVWVGFEDGRHAGKCMFYHPSPRWLEANGYPTELAGCIEIANAKNFLGWTHDQPWMVLHELAHGYHHQVLGHGHAGVRAAYGKAKQSGSYDKVLRIDGSETRHYALENDQEYFAELSEAWFGTNDFYPFVRAELRRHDEAGYRLLEEVWGKRRR